MSAPGLSDGLITSAFLMAASLTLVALVGLVAAPAIWWALLIQGVAGAFLLLLLADAALTVWRMPRR